MATRSKAKAKRKAPSKKKKTSRRSASARSELQEVRDHLAAIEGGVVDIKKTLPEVARASDIALLTELLQDFPSQLAGDREEEAAETVSPRGSSEDRWRSVVADLAASSSGAALAIHQALDALPRDPDYARFAGQLRELATVSPSLMEWLGQIPTITLPLGEAVASLRRAAGRLDAASVRAEASLSDAGEVPSVSVSAKPKARRRKKSV